MARSSSGEPTLRRARSPSPRALPGYVIDGGASWSHSFALPQFTAGAVTFIDHSGTARDTYAVPSVEGVEYLVGGKVVKASTHVGSGTVKVTARALPGYELTGASS